MPAIEVQGAPNDTLFHEIAGMTDKRRTQIGEPNCVDDTPSGGLLAQCLRLRARQPNRLFAKKRFALCNSAPSDLGMGVARHRDDDGIGLIDGLAPIGGCMRKT